MPINPDAVGAEGGAVDSTYQLKVKISKVVLRHLFSGEPLPKTEKKPRATDDDW